MAKNVGIKITADSSQAKSAIQEVTAGLNKLSKSKALTSVSKLGSAMSGLSSTLDIAKGAVGAVVNTISDLSQASLVQERAEKTLATAVKNNPFYDNSATERLKAYASQLQATSTIGDEELIPFMANLVSYGRSEAETMDIMQTAVNLAESGVMSLSSAVKALNTTFSGEAGELASQIPALKNLSKEQLKAGEGVKLLKEQYAGAAEEISNSIGAVQKMKNSWGDLKEHIGRGINSLLNPLAKGFGYLVDGINEAVAGFKKSEIEVEGIKRIIESIPGVKTEGAGKVGYVEDNSKAQLEAYKKAVDEIKEQYKTIETDLPEAEKAFKRLEDLKSNYRLRHDMRQGKNIKEWNEIQQQYLDAEAELQRLQNVYRDYQLDNGLIGSTEEGPLKKAEERYKTHLAEINKNDTEATADLEKQYSDFVKKTEEEIANRRKAGEEISKEAEAQELLNKKQDFYIKKLNEGYKENENIKTSINNQNAEFEKQRDLKKQSDSIQVYKDEVTNLEKELTARKSSGEALSREAEARALLNVHTQGYLNMLKAGVSAESKEAKNALEKINLLSKEVEGYENLKLSVDTVTKESEEYIKAHDEIKELKLSDSIAQTISVLEAEAEKVKEDTELYKAYIEQIEKLKGLKGQTKDLENKDFAQSLSQPKTEADKILEEYRQNKSNFEALDIQNTLMAEEEKLKIKKDFALRQRQLMSSLVEYEIGQVASYIDQYAQCMNQISSLVQSNAENEATVKQASLEKQYAEGTVSEEEYYKKKEEIEKEAARKKYKIQMWEWTAQVAQTTAQIAQSVANALAQGGPYAGPALAVMMGALGAVQLSAVIGAKPVPPSFATGGIVGGNSYYGDKVQANVNSGEMILNRRQQANLFDMIGAGRGGSIQNNINVQNNASGVASVDIQKDTQGIKIIIDKTVKESLESGNYRRSLQQNNLLMNGVTYTS